MKYKKISFSILEAIEKNKIEKEIIKIKNLCLTEKKNHQQLKILINYKQEYEKKIYNKIISGVCIYDWRNHENFISILRYVIKDNRDIIKKTRKIIQESLTRWSTYKKQLKIWKHLNTINHKKILKINKIKEQTLNDNYSQLKFLNEK